MTSGRTRVRIRSSQLGNGDFPAVCAMTGAPAETWHRFRFSTPLSGSFTQREAQQLARAVSKTNANNATYSPLASVLSIVGAFLFLVGVLSLFVAPIFTGPTAKVLPRAGGEYDNAIELRRVHPAFVEAVERQLAGVRDG